MPNLIDLTGKKFNRLTVIERAPNQGKSTMWHCACDCGNDAVVSSSHLKNGNVKSCGCLHAEVSAKRLTTHGLSHLPEYGIWKTMKRRCYALSEERYRDYGGRGIKVCERWCNSFEAFYKDMGPRPSPDHSLDRIDNNGDYEPSNVHWATYKEQARNARSNRLVTLQGQTHCVAEWSEITGIYYMTLINRLNSGWPIEKALTEPVRNH